MPDYNPENFIEVRGLKKVLGGNPVLRGVDLDIVRGDCTVILGRSGEGKSVCLKHLLGLIQPDSGSIVIDGDEIVGLEERQLNPVRKKVGILFQDGALFDSMTITENVVFPLVEEGIRNKKVLLEKAEEVLTLVGLETHMEKMPNDISGGMRKRVALARAVITRPQCILYDEPTAGLDPVMADSIDHLIRRLADEFEVTSVVVTHDMKSMNHIADRVAILRNGQIYFNGTPPEVNASDDEWIRHFIEGISEETLAERNKNGEER